MTEMLDRVAAIIRRETADRVTEPDFNEIASDVIVAMLEPTAEMLDAGDRVCGIFRHAEKTWKRMIDAALMVDDYS